MTFNRTYAPPAAFTAYRAAQDQAAGARTSPEDSPAGSSDAVTAPLTLPLSTAARAGADGRPPGRTAATLRHLLSMLAGHRRAALIATVVGAVVVVATIPPWSPGGSTLSTDGRVSLAVLAGAIGAWTTTRWGDTYIGLAAVTVLALTGVVAPDAVFAVLGGELIWLLIAAFVLAHALSATGLPALLAVRICAGASSPRRLAHRLGIAMLVSALAVPSTSGRAALAVPILRALGVALPTRLVVLRALSLVCPTAILLSAIATLTGAGAHLITDQVLTAFVGQGIGFGAWLLWGLPFAVVSSVIGVEIALRTMTSAADRRETLHLDRAELASAAGLDPVAADAPWRRALNPDQRRILVVLGAIVLMWCTEPVHGLSTAFVALLGALVVSLPKLGSTQLPAALGSVPWPLLLFVGTTSVMASALAGSGAATFLGALAIGGNHGGIVVLVLVVLVSAAAHLILQSRSARSSVIIPLVVAAAATAGLNPVALAFASTAAAGFCHTLPSSAKPIALFTDLDDVPGFSRRDLLRLSARLGPAMVVLVVLFAVAVWPALGLPLF